MIRRNMKYLRTLLIYIGIILFSLAITMKDGLCDGIIVLGICLIYSTVYLRVEYGSDDFD